MQRTSYSRQYLSPFVACIDVIIVIGCSLFAYWLRFPGVGMDLKIQSATAGTAMLLLLCSTVTGLYDSWRGRSLAALIKRYTFNLVCVASILVAFLVFTKSAHMFSRLWLGFFILSVWLAGITYRSLHFFILKRLRRTGKNLRRVLFITASDQKQLSELKDDLQEFGYEIAGIVPIAQFEEHLNKSTLSDEILKHQACEIWINLPLNMGSFVKDIVYALRHETVDIRYIPDFADIQLLNHKTSNIAGLFTIDISCSPLDGFNRILKRGEDLLLGSLITLLILPVCLIIAILVRLDSPGPVIFKQMRNGLDGKRVKVYKFRSMEVHSEQDGAITQATPGDPRITKFGAFLRQTSLDELPQFFNVLQGRMSIVGPRPHALEHNEYYKDMVESYMWRHKVKPGITGLAQIRGLRGFIDTIDKMEKRVECDLEYINNWSIWLDLKIIILTCYKGFFSKNAF